MIWSISREIDQIIAARLHGDRLFGQHMLSGGQRLQRPLDMHVIGQRNIDRIDARIGQQRLIALVHPQAGAERQKPRSLRRI
jgi:hypothetical protein